MAYMRAMWHPGRLYGQLHGCVAYWHDVWPTRGLLGILRGFVTYMYYGAMWHAGRQCGLLAGCMYRLLAGYKAY